MATNKESTERRSKFEREQRRRTGAWSSVALVGSRSRSNHSPRWSSISSPSLFLSRIRPRRSREADVDCSATESPTQFLLRFGRQPTASDRQLDSNQTVSRRTYHMHYLYSYNDYFRWIIRLNQPFIPFVCCVLWVISSSKSGPIEVFMGSKFCRSVHLKNTCLAYLLPYFSWTQLIFFSIWPNWTDKTIHARSALGARCLNSLSQLIKLIRYHQNWHLHVSSWMWRLFISF